MSPPSRLRRLLERKHRVFGALSTAAWLACAMGCGDGAGRRSACVLDDAAVSDASVDGDATTSDGSVTTPCASPLGFEILQLGTSASDEAFALGIDSECHVYVAGTTLGKYAEGEPSEPGAGADVFVHRIGPNGMSDWTRQYGSFEDDELGALAVSPSGGIVVVGTTYGVMPGAPFMFAGTDAYAMRVASSGERLWTSQYGSLEDDFALDVVARSNGDFVVAGATNENPVLALEASIDALDATTGAVVERHRFGSDEPDRAEGLAFAGDGTLHVVGGTLGDFGTDALGSFDVFTLRLGPEVASRPRVHQRGTDDIDAAVDVAVDRDGNVYVAAVSFSDLLSGSFENDGIQNGFLFKFDSGGALVWARRVGPVDSMGSVTAVFVDDRGDVFVAGRTRGDVAATNAGGYDVVVARFGADGEPRGARQLGTGGDDVARDLVVTLGGDVVIVGSTGGALAGSGSDLGDLDVFVARFDRASFD